MLNYLLIFTTRKENRWSTWRVFPNWSSCYAKRFLGAATKVRGIGSIVWSRCLETLGKNEEPWLSDFYMYKDLLFAREKCCRCSLEPCLREYISPRTLNCLMGEITTWAWIRISRENSLPRTSLFPWNREKQ